MNQNEEKQKHAGREKMHLLLQFLKPVLPFFCGGIGVFHAQYGV